MTGDAKAEETNELLQEVVALFSEKGDVLAVKEAGRAIADLHATGEERHKQMLQSIKGASPAPRRTAPPASPHPTQPPRRTLPSDHDRPNGATGVRRAVGAGAALEAGVSRAPVDAAGSDAKAAAPH